MAQALDPGAAPSTPALADSVTALRIAVLTGFAYYVGARIGLALTFEPLPMSVLWPPNALLLAALILTPRNWWWAAIAGAFPAHLLAELPAGVPLPMVLCWFVSNTAEALVGAIFLRHWSAQASLHTLRNVVGFCYAAVLAPFLSSFLDVAFVLSLGWSDDSFARLWQVRFFSNLLAILIFVPLVMTWSIVGADGWRYYARGRLPEIGALVAGLFAVSVVVFDSRLTSVSPPSAVLYLPVPFLIWAALRFGPALSSALFATVAFVVIWGASHGRGPFLEAAMQQDAMPIQLFLAGIAVPLLLLAAVIEERRDAERKLRASEELFASAFRHGPDPVCISRMRDGAVLEANHRWLQILGYAPDTSVGALAPLVDHLDEPSRRRLRALEFRDSLPGAEIELNLRDRLGVVHSAIVAVAQVEVQGEPCHITILRDITQQRRAENEAHDQRRQLTHLTRVASLSDFSSTIAHELNQPLTAILSNAQAALRFLSREPPNIVEIKTILGEIAEADKRAGLLIHHLRLLMKKGEEEFVPTDLNHLVAEALDLVRGEFLLRSVEVRTNYAPDLPQVLCDRVQVQQLILNLVGNACEAMQGQARGRTLSVSSSQAADGSVQVIVTDTGPGMSPDGLERAFDPFYTTKESGLGMGLAICRRIASAHGGMLTAQSRPGEGATFRLTLPPVVPGPRGANPSPHHLDAGTTSTATAS